MSETPAAVHVVDHDPARPRRVATAIADLRAAAPGLFVELEHIGSTAVASPPSPSST